MLRRARAEVGGVSAFLGAFLDVVSLRALSVFTGRFASLLSFFWAAVVYLLSVGGAGLVTFAGLDGADSAASLLAFGSCEPVSSSSLHPARPITAHSVTEMMIRFSMGFLGSNIHRAWKA